MLARKLGELGGRKIGGANAVHFVGGNHHTDARTANEHAVIIIALRHGTGGTFGVIGIVDALLAVATEVIDNKAKALEPRLELFLLLEATVIRCQRDAQLCHCHALSSLCANLVKRGVAFSSLLSHPMSDCREAAAELARRIRVLRQSSQDRFVKIAHLLQMLENAAHLH